MDENNFSQNRQDEITRKANDFKVRINYEDDNFLPDIQSAPAQTEVKKNNKKKKAIVLSSISIVLVGAILAVYFTGAYKDIKGLFNSLISGGDVFTVQWEKTGGFGGGGYGSFGGSYGEYPIEKFEVDDALSIPEDKKVNAYKANKLSFSKETLAAVKEKLIEVFDFKEVQREDKENKVKYTEYVDEKGAQYYFPTNESDTEYFYMYRGLNNELVKEFKENYKSYSLSKLKKDGEKVAKNIAKEIGEVLGKEFTYFDCVKYDTTISMEIEEEKNNEKGLYFDAADLTAWKYRFTTEKSLRTLDSGDSEANLIGYIPENSVFDDIKQQYFEVYLYPDLTVNEITDNIINNSFSVSEKRQMFTKAQLADYKCFSNLNVCLNSDKKDDTAVFNKFYGYYYNYPDFTMSEDRSAGAYALLGYYLKSNPQKEYQLGVYIDAVRENISTYDSLYSQITVDETPQIIDQPTKQYYDTHCTLSPDFCLKNVDPFDPPYFYKIKQNPNADKIPEAFRKTFGDSAEVNELNNDFCTIYNNNNINMYFNKYTGLSECSTYLFDNQVKKYIKEYSGKTMNVNGMRSVANAAAENFSAVYGKLSYTDCFRTSYEMYADGKKYNASAYRFVYKNDEYNEKLYDEKKREILLSSFDNSNNVGTFEVTVLADNTIVKMTGYIFTGFEKTNQLEFSFDDIKDTIFSSEEKDDTAIVLNMSSYSYKFSTDSSYLTLCADFVYRFEKFNKDTTYLFSAFIMDRKANPFSLEETE